MRWAEHEARMREVRNSYKILIGNLKGRNQSEDLDIDENELELTLDKQGGKVWTGFIWLSKWTSGGLK
jgi:hypothetical protein